MKQKCSSDDEGDVEENVSEQILAASSLFRAVCFGFSCGIYQWFKPRKWQVQRVVNFLISQIVPINLKI